MFCHTLQMEIKDVIFFTHACSVPNSDFLILSAKVPGRGGARRGSTWPVV